MALISLTANFLQYRTHRPAPGLDPDPDRSSASCPMPIPVDPQSGLRSVACILCFAGADRLSLTRAEEAVAVGIEAFEATVQHGVDLRLVDRGIAILVELDESLGGIALAGLGSGQELGAAELAVAVRIASHKLLFMSRHEGRRRQASRLPAGLAGRGRRLISRLGACRDRRK